MTSSCSLTTIPLVNAAAAHYTFMLYSFAHFNFRDSDFLLNLYLFSAVKVGLLNILSAPKHPFYKEPPLNIYFLSRAT